MPLWAGGCSCDIQSLFWLAGRLHSCLLHCARLGWHGNTLAFRILASRCLQCNNLHRLVHDSPDSGHCSPSYARPRFACLLSSLPIFVIFLHCLVLALFPAGYPCNTVGCKEYSYWSDSQRSVGHLFCHDHMCHTIVAYAYTLLRSRRVFSC